MDRDKILSLLKTKGPLVPNDIKKLIGGDTMILGAVLSELSTRGFVAISHLKKGSSPFYYIPGQESQLERFTEFLNPKDQQTQQLLKQEKVLQDHALELFHRVSIRQIKDFAKPFTMQTSQGDIVFWRYYLISEQEAKNFLMQKYAPPKKEEPQQEIETPAPAIQQEITSSSPSQDTQRSSSLQDSIKERKQTVSEKQATLPTASATKNESISDIQQQSMSSLAITPFYEAVRDYFSKASIAVVEEKLIAKNREYTFLIQVPSAVGHMDMFCFAKNKKKLNQNDVAPAILRAQKYNLPCFFLTNGEFTKKSKETIKQEHKGVIIKTFTWDDD